MAHYMLHFIFDSVNSAVLPCSFCIWNWVVLLSSERKSIVPCLLLIVKIKTLKNCHIVVQLLMLFTLSLFPITLNAVVVFCTGKWSIPTFPLITNISPGKILFFKGLKRRSMFISNKLWSHTFSNSGQNVVFECWYTRFHDIQVLMKNLVKYKAVNFKFVLNTWCCAVISYQKMER